MRRLAVLALTSTALSFSSGHLSFSFACGLSVTGDPAAASADAAPSSSSSSSSSPPSDSSSSTSSDDAGGSSSPDAAPDASFVGSGCVPLKSGTIAPFAYEGEPNGYVANAQGVTLSVSSGKKAQLNHTFDAGKIYTSTSVDLHLGIFWDSGSWGSSGDDYTTLIQQFYGATRSESTSSRADVTMAQNVLDLNVWAPTQKNYGLGGMKLPGPDTHLIVTTKWAAPPLGNAVVTTTPPTAGISKWTLSDIPTAVTAAADKLTLTIGGTGTNVVPNLRVIIFDVCITFDPP